MSAIPTGVTRDVNDSNEILKRRHCHFLLNPFLPPHSLLLEVAGLEGTHHQADPQQHFHDRELLAMRFRFCGGLEPPDWLLAEIPLLRSLTEAQALGVCHRVCRDSEEIALGDVVVTDAQDAKAIAAVLRFVLFQAAKYDISEGELSVELLQLGVNNEVCQAVAAVYRAERLELRKHLQSSSFKFPTIEQLKWRVHHANPLSQDSKDLRVEMRLQLDRQMMRCGGMQNGPQSKSDTLAITMTDDKFLALYEELAQAQTILQTLKRS